MIRLATKQDVEAIMSVYDLARKTMRKSGNDVQWVGGYPRKETVEQDIRENQAYVYEEGQQIHAVFVLQYGEEPTYGIIDGSWKNEEPYATIHRVGSDGVVKGIFEKCVCYCKEESKNLRIDTHESNQVMQYLIKKNQFEYCGIVKMADGTTRLAYQY